MSDSALLQVLERHGYHLRYREHEWVECLLVGGSESFRGQGIDRPAALENALSAAFPSRIARDLLDVAVAAAGRSVSTVAAVAAVGATSLDAVSSLAPSVEDTIPNVVRPLDRSWNNRVPPASPARALPPLSPRLAEVRGEADRVRALEDLEILAERIEDARDELAWSTAPRQRLAILAWICEARSHTDVFPEDAEIREAVARVSRQLTEIGKAFWPGSVTALQLQMQPTDLPKHLLGGVPSTWASAAELAERALHHLVHADDRRGQDLYGWGDEAALSPPPPNPKEILQQLVQAVEDSWGPLDRFAEPRNPEDLPQATRYQRWVRELRWIRGQDVDPDMWARVMGRLRWWACRRNGPVQAEGRELEPGYRPETTWADLLGHDLSEQDGLHKGRTLAPEIRRSLQGKRVLCVSQRRDKLEQSKLTEMLPELTFEWRLLDATAIEGLSPEIIARASEYDLLLAAVGLQSSALDLALARAARSADKPYVRANRGQADACLRGLARTAGSLS